MNRPTGSARSSLNRSSIQTLSDQFKVINVDASHGINATVGAVNESEDFQLDATNNSDYFNALDQQIIGHSVEDEILPEHVDHIEQSDNEANLVVTTSSTTTTTTVAEAYNAIDSLSPTRQTTTTIAGQLPLTNGNADAGGYITKTDSSPNAIATAEGQRSNSITIQKPPIFQLSKQHTGLKNRSQGVGMAVTPTNIMEFEQAAREDFGVVKINRPPGHNAAKLSPTNTKANLQSVDETLAGLSSNEGLTDQGYYDLKFYHNKLW